jgi:hypothetical protein
MKKIIFLILCAGAIWWYFIGGRTVTEESVREFYQKQEVAMLERLPEELCGFLDSNFQSTNVTTVGGESRTDSVNKDQACESTRKLYQSFEAMGEKMGGMVQLDHSYTINSIEIAPDKKSATVDVSDSLDVAGSMMNIRSRSTDTIIRKNGKLLMLSSIDKATLGSPE